jgi:hypothetical protein
MKPRFIGVLQSLTQGTLTQQDLAHGCRPILGRQTATDRRITLRIHVDQKHSLARQGQGRRQIDGGRGFPHAALLIGDCDYAAHAPFLIDL